MTDLPEYREGAVDLLGVLAYGQLVAFARLADDAHLVPALADRVQLSELAVKQFEQFRRLGARLSEFGVDVMTAMAPFHHPFDSFHERTTPKTWVEGLVKAYVGDGFAADFYAEIAAFVDPGTRELVLEVLTDEGQAAFLVDRIRAEIQRDPDCAGRLALWGRRLVGEALSHAQRVAAEREALTSLLTGSVDRPGLDLPAMNRLFSRLVENHTKRMSALGLAS